MFPMTRFRVVLACVAGLVGCAEVDSPPEAADAPRPVVYAVNYPLAYFAERIGGDLVEVRLPAPAGKEPGAEEVAAIQKADLILLQGSGYARWVDTVSLPLSRTVDTTAGFRERYIEIEDAVTHSHGPEGEHSHGGLA
ncbi:MAG: zinc ABC transporter solute-binding protein, partial [bacterium]|nr:zinc ABC transporter solute-binding protein [bacterium]